MNLGDVNYIIHYYLGQRDQDIVVHPEDFARRLHVAQLKHFKRKIGLPEAYQPGMPLPPQVFEITKVITDDLAPFKVYMGGTSPALAVDSNGESDLPSDFYYPSTCSYKYVKDGEVNYKEVELVTDAKWLERISSFIARPSLKHPIGNIYGSKIRFYPHTLKYVEFMYLKVPTAPVYGVTRITGYPKYDSTTSTELEWNDTNIIDIIVQFLADMAITIDSQAVANFAEKSKLTGT